MNEEVKIYWIWEPTQGVEIGITSDGYLVSTSNVITEEDIMNTFLVPKSQQVTDEDLDKFENKDKSDEIEFVPGKIPQKYIEETYKIIDEYYETIKDYTPNIVPVEPKSMKALNHGPHYIVTPPAIHTDEASIEKIRDLIARISKRSQEIMIPQEKIQELFDKLAAKSLTSFTYDYPEALGNMYFYFNCCGFRWYAQMVEFVYYLGGGSMTKTRVEVGFSPRNDIDVLMFYKKMKEGKIWVNDVEEFRKEFEETIFFIPTEWQPKEELDKQKSRVINNIDKYLPPIINAIDGIVKTWKCALEDK